MPTQRSTDCPPSPGSSSRHAPEAPAHSAKPGAGTRRQWGQRVAALGLIALGAAGGLTACASLNLVQSSVSSFGSWPAGRAAGRYAFDRLPSQQTDERRADQESLERLADAALRAAGFSAAAAGEPVDVLVQVGARISRQQPAPWEDPFWPAGAGRRWPARHAVPLARPLWHGSLYLGRSDEFQREVALLLRDRTSGEVLFEARASTEGLTEGGHALLGAMFKAAIQDFPNARPEPHPVAVALGD